MHADDAVALGIEGLVAVAVFDQDDINLALHGKVLVKVGMWVVLIGVRSKELVRSRVDVEAGLVVL